MLYSLVWVRTSSKQISFLATQILGTTWYGCILFFLTKKNCINYPVVLPMQCMYLVSLLWPILWTRCPFSLVELVKFGVYLMINYSPANCPKMSTSLRMVLNKICTLKINSECSHQHKERVWMSGQKVNTVISLIQIDFN